MSTDTTEQVSKLEGRRTDTLAPQTAVKSAKTKRSLRQIDSDSDSDDIPRRLEKRPSLPDETGAETKEDNLGAQALISLKKTEPNSDAARLKQTKAEFEDSRKQTDLCIPIPASAPSYRQVDYRQLMELQAENRGLNEQLQAKNTENDSLKDTIRLLQAEIQEREQTVIDLTNEEEV